MALEKIEETNGYIRVPCGLILSRIDWKVLPKSERATNSPNILSLGPHVLLSLKSMSICLCAGTLRLAIRASLNNQWS
jgi:hypothetical protein